MEYCSARISPALRRELDHLDTLRRSCLHLTRVAIDGAFNARGYSLGASMVCSVCVALRVMAALSVVAAIAFFSDRAFAAGAAYQVDTAEVSEPGSCKVESWASSAGNRDFIAAIAPACVVNMFRPFELSAQVNRSRSDEEWSTGLSPKVKTNILPSAIGRWGVAITTNATIDLQTGENTAWFVAMPATLRLTEVVRINVNAGYQRDRQAARNYFTYGAGFDWRTPDNVWTLTGEMFGQAGTAEVSSVVAPRFQLGLRWRPVDRFNVDLIYGRNIAGENANWITVATVVRFPPREEK